MYIVIENNTKLLRIHQKYHRGSEWPFQQHFMALLWDLKFIIRVTSKRGWHGGIYFPQRTFSVEKKRNLGSGSESETILEVWMKMRDSRDSCSSPAEPSLTQVAAWWWGKCQVRATLLYTLYTLPPPPRCYRTARHLANQQAPPSSGIRAERFRERILIRLQSKRFRVSGGFNLQT